MTILIIALNTALGVFNLHLARTLKQNGMNHKFQVFASRLCFLAAGLMVYVNYLR